MFKNHVPSYSFNSFAETPSNSDAIKVSKNFAKINQHDMSTLIIEGNEGVGKYHLANAIANYRVENKLAKRKVVVSCHEVLMKYHNTVKKFNDDIGMSIESSVLIIASLQSLFEFHYEEKFEKSFTHFIKTIHDKNNIVILTASCVTPTSKHRLEKFIKNSVIENHATINQPQCHDLKILYKHLCNLKKICFFNSEELEKKAIKCGNIRELEMLITKHKAAISLGY